jgi:hypothetical protein
MFDEFGRERFRELKFFLCRTRHVVPFMFQPKFGMLFGSN